MKKTGKKTIALVALLSIALLVVTFSYVSLYHNYVTLNADMNVALSFTKYSIHTTYTFEKNGKVIAQYYHAGAVTQLGLNYTLGKIVGAYGNTTYPYNQTTTLMNCTYVSIGTGSPTTASHVLPGEWNRTWATIHDATYNQFNLTAVFHPNTGPYTADCIGVNWASAIGADWSLWGYDTFGQVTGIDATFTITVEVKISAS